MHVLITGGTGLIGRALSGELLTKRHQVTILSRNPQQHQAAMPGVKMVKWNGRTPEGWGHLIETADAVVSMAGASIAGESVSDILTQHWNDESKQRIRQSRLHAGQAIVQAIEVAEKKPRVLLQASAVGYYGPHGSEDVTEASPPGSDFLAQVCLDWENSSKPVETMGVRRVITRTGLVLSKEGGILPIMLLPFRFFAGGPVGNGRQGISWIHIQDEIEAIIYLLENESAQGAYNLCAPTPVTNAQFGKTVGQVLQRPSRIPAPAFALKLLLGEKATLVLDGQLALPTRLLEAGYNFAFTDLEPALRDLLS